ncbi:MAG: MFS transporter [Phycisphaerae bacterium]
MRVNTNNIPFAPARWPFFYGWFVLALGTLGVIMSVPGQTIGVSAFIEPVMDAMGLTRTAFSLSYGIGTAAGALFLTWGGKLYDRYGARIVGFVSAVALGVVLLGLSRLDAIASGLTGLFGEYVVDTFFGEIAVVTFLVATTGFLLLRFTGQGMLTVVSRNMIMKWFHHRRGLANGIMSMFVPMMFALAPLTLHTLNKTLTWRGTWMLLGAVLAGGFGLVVLVFYRDNPENCGLEPDGGLHGRPDDPRHHPKRDFTLPEARRTYAFWVFNLALTLQALYVTAVTFHVESIFDQVGIEEDVAFMTFLPSSVMTVLTAICGGWISDHVKLKRLLKVMLAAMALSMVGLLLLHNPAAMWMYIISRGVAGGLFGLLLGLTWPRLFGKSHLGAISGFQMSWTVVGSAAGPGLFAISLQLADSYRWSIGVCLAVAVTLFVLALKADRPDPPDERPAEVRPATPGEQA